ncbi:hypothetical protein [Spirosoma arcticum]
MINKPLDDIEDVLNRVARLNALIHTHESQPQPDRPTIEGYQRVRPQFADDKIHLLAQQETN